MEKKEKISNFLTLVDTSSVVTHDLCAQLHVLQFCLEELEDHVSDSGREYLNRMRVSTHYVADLVNSFRKQLKISLSDDVPEPLDRVFGAAMELVKNHFSGVFDKLDLSSTEDMSSFILKDNAQKFMFIIFSLYATFIEEFKKKVPDEQDRLRMKFLAKSENSRFVQVEIEVKHTCIDEKYFEKILSLVTAEKGKLRKFVGLNLLKDFRKENSKWFKMIFTDDRAIINFKIPLYLDK